MRWDFEKTADVTDILKWTTGLLIAPSILFGSAFGLYSSFFKKAHPVDVEIAKEVVRNMLWRQKLYKLYKETQMTPVEAMTVSKAYDIINPNASS